MAMNLSIFRSFFFVLLFLLVFLKGRGFLCKTYMHVFRAETIIFFS